MLLLTKLMQKLKLHMKTTQTLMHLLTLKKQSYQILKQVQQLTKQAQR
jgi:hypothetical protein